MAKQPNFSRLEITVVENGYIVRQPRMEGLIMGNEPVPECFVFATLAAVAHWLGENLAVPTTQIIAEDDDAEAI